jgi:hypothetical protein
MSGGRPIRPSAAQGPAAAAASRSRPVAWPAGNLSRDELAIVAAGLAALSQRLTEFQRRLSGLEATVESAWRTAADSGPDQRQADQLEAG